MTNISSYYRGNYIYSKIIEKETLYNLLHPNAIQECLCFFFFPEEGRINATLRGQNKGI